LRPVSRAGSSAKRASAPSRRAGRPSRCSNPETASSCPASPPGKCVYCRRLMYSHGTQAEFVRIPYGPTWLLTALTALTRPANYPATGKRTAPEHRQARWGRRHQQVRADEPAAYLGHVFGYDGLNFLPSVPGRGGPHPSIASVPTRKYPLFVIASFAAAANRKSCSATLL
jgi:hypothetical protein